MRWPKPDIWIIVIIAAGGFMLAARYVETFRATGQQSDFAQYEFGAAVAAACGHGFSDPVEGASASYAEFLQVKRDAISCADLPAGTRFGPPSFSQGLYRYLMETVSLVWWVRGISWSGLWPVFGLAYALTLVAAYGLFRLGMRPPIATAATVLLAVSAIHLAHVVYLRDYAKAPFILALILITAWFARTGTTAGRRIWLSTAFGVTLGIGFGFRNDLLILLPAFVAVVALRCGGLSRRDIVLRCACLSTAALAFLLVAWPLVVSYSRGSNNGHVILLGFMSNFDRPLGVRPSLYDFGHQYSDSLVATLANSFSVRTTGASVPYVSREYDRALMTYIGDIVRNFPADIVTRAYASSLRIFELPFAVGAHTNPTPYGIQSDVIQGLYRRENVVLHGLYGKGAFMVAGALVIISAYDVAGALLLTAFVLYFAGYPAIQFHVRHFFHLEFITWWACGFILQTAIAAPFVWRNAVWRPKARRVVTFLILAAVLLALPLAVLRWYQNSHVRQLLGRYQDAPKVALDLSKVETADGRVLFTVPDLWPGDIAGGHERAKISVETEYLTATFSSAGCDAVALPVVLRYETRSEATDFSRQITIPFAREKSSMAIMFAAFWDKRWSRFKGIELAASDAGCFVGLERTTDLRGLTLALNVMYFPDWQSRPLYQSIAEWEQPEPVSTPSTTVVPDTLLLRRGYLYGPLTDAGPRLIPQSSIAAGAVQGPVTLRGVPEGAYVYLVKYESKTVDSNAVFVVEGKLIHGGLTIGLLRDNGWARYANVTTPGPFRVVIQPAGAGSYQAAIANNLNETLIESRRRVAAALRRVGILGPTTNAVIERIGWFESPVSGGLAH